MKPFARLAAGLALLLASAAASEAQPAFPADTTMAKIVAARKIRIGVKYDQPLFGLRNLRGEVVGYDVEIGKIIARKLSLKPSEIEWVETVSANREAFIEQNKVDLIIATYAITPKRREVVTFAGPYLVTGQDILIKKGNPAHIEKIEDLVTKRVCVLNGSEGRATMVREFPQVPLIAFDSFTKCAEAIKNGSLDAGVIGEPVILGYVSKEPDKLDMVGKRIGVERSAVGMKKGDIPLCEFVTKTLTEAAADGSYKRAYDETVGKFAKAPWSLPQFDPCS